MNLAKMLICTLAAAAAPAALASESADLSPGKIAQRVREAMDTTADPCQDFYRYACGGWIEKTELPSDRARWTRSFSVIQEANREFIRDVLKDAADSPGDDPDRKKLGDFYGSCMDEKAVEKAGTGPLEPLMKLASKVEDTEDLIAVSAKLQRWDIGSLLSLAVYPDFKNPDLNIAWFFQGGLGMPDRDY